MIASAETIIHELAIFAGAVGGFVFLVVMSWVAARRPWRTMNAKFGKIEFSLDQVNRAVNHVPAGTPTLVKRVGALEAGQQWEREALAAIAGNVGVELPAFPDVENDRR